MRIIDWSSDVCSSDLVIHPRARAILADYYESRGGLNEGRLRMARVPEGAVLIENATSGAPGIRMGNVFVLAGVPRIALNMMDALRGTLEGGRPLLSPTTGCSVHASEGAATLQKGDRAHEGG